MKAWVVTNSKEVVRGISTWGESYAWYRALNQIPSGITMYETIKAFEAIGWKCKEYDLVLKEK